MPKRWIGVTVASEAVTVIDAEVPDSGPLVIQADLSWPLQKGPRPAAYHVMHQQVTNYVKEQGIKRVVIKSSALSLSGTKKAHLEAAELRGVVMCGAVSAGAQTQLISKAHTSRTFGKRKVGEYVRDDGFWADKLVGEDVRKGSREAAMLLLAARKG